jgi:hypothetical protein
MNFMVLVAIIVGGTAATFTDWLFMGVLFHERYLRYPEVWWPVQGGNNAVPIIKSALVGYAGTAGVVLLCWTANAHALQDTLPIAVLAWLAGSVPVLITNGFFIKIDPLVTCAHLAGWLARALLAAAAFTFLV